MANLVAWSEDDSKRIANTVKVVERGALEHPFYRARWPAAAGGDEVVLMTSAETTVVGGPPKAFSGGVNGGVTPQIEMYLVPRGLHDIPATASIDFDTTYQVNCGGIGTLVFGNNLNGIGVLPQNSVWAVQRKANQTSLGFTGETEYFAIAGGTSMFTGVVATVLGGDQYEVTPTDMGGTPNNITCEALFSEIFVVGQEVAIAMIGVYPTIVNAGCMP